MYSTNPVTSAQLTLPEPEILPESELDSNIDVDEQVQKDLEYTYKSFCEIYDAYGRDPSGKFIVELFERAVNKSVSAQEFEIVKHFAQFYRRGHEQVTLTTPLMWGEEVDEAFKVVEQQLNGAGVGPKPVRLERIRRVFQDRERKALPLDEFAKEFSETTDPRKSASNALSWLNKMFHQCELPWEIHSQPIDGIKYYSLRRLTKP